MKPRPTTKQKLPLGPAFAKLIVERHRLGVAREDYINDIEMVLAELISDEVREMIVSVAAKPKVNRAVIYEYRKTHRLKRALVHFIIFPDEKLLARYKELGIIPLQERLARAYPPPLKIIFEDDGEWCRIYLQWPHYSASVANVKKS